MSKRNAFFQSIPVSTHVVNFHTNERPELPEWFKQTDAYKYHDVKMCIGAGDNPENIVNMLGFDVYISLPERTLYGEQIGESIRLAEQNNKLLIFINIDTDIPELAHLVNLFEHRVSLLDNDDPRVIHHFGIKNAIRMLRPGGILMHDYSKSFTKENPPEPGADITMSTFFKTHYGKHPLEGKQIRLPSNGRHERGIGYEYFVSNLPKPSSEIIIDLSVKPKYGWNVLPEQWIAGREPKKPGPYNAIVIRNNTKLPLISDKIHFYDIIIYIGMSQQTDKIWKDNLIPNIESLGGSNQIACFVKLNNQEQYIKLAILLENKINILDADNELSLKSLGNDNIYHMLTIGGKCMANLNMPTRFDCGTSQHPMIEGLQAIWGARHVKSFSPEKTFNVCVKKEETGREGGGAGGVPAMGGAPLYRRYINHSELEELPNNVPAATVPAATVPAATNLTVTGNNVPALGSPQYYASLAAPVPVPAPAPTPVPVPVPAPSTLNWLTSYIPKMPWSKGGKRHTKRKRSSKKKRYSRTRKYNK